MPLAGGTPVPESRVGTLPGDLFRLATDGTMTRRAFDGTILGAPSTMATRTTGRPSAAPSSPAAPPTAATGQASTA